MDKKINALPDKRNASVAFLSKTKKNQKNFRVFPVLYFTLFSIFKNYCSNVTSSAINFLVNKFSPSNAQVHYFSSWVMKFFITLLNPAKAMFILNFRVGFLSFFVFWFFLLFFFSYKMRDFQYRRVIYYPFLANVKLRTFSTISSIVK